MWELGWRCLEWLLGGEAEDFKRSTVGRREEVGTGGAKAGAGRMV